MKETQGARRCEKEVVKQVAFGAFNERLCVRRGNRR
jgi:hypothetical protein